MPSDFKSDGCTGFFDLTHRSCCVAHDWSYFIGLEISTADLDLYKCVAGISGVCVAGVMLYGLKFFGPLYRKIRPYIRK